MRSLIARLAAVVLLSLIPDWAFAGNKIELTDGEMDEVTAAGGFLDVLLLKNPGIRSFTFNSSNSHAVITVNGSPVRIENRPASSNGALLPVELVTSTKAIGSQPGLGDLGLINKTTPVLFRSNSNATRFYRSPIR